MNELPTIRGYTNTSTSYTGVGAINQLTTSANMNDLTASFNGFINKSAPVKIKGEKVMPKKRLVQVFIADPDQKMPLDNSMLYEGKSFLTDSDDEELFFDLPIKELLTKHNEKREKTLDKKHKSERYLEPIRIRDLKMTVVTLAEF